MPPKKAQKKRRGGSFMSSVGDLVMAGIGGVAGIDETINKLENGERHGIAVLKNGKRAYFRFVGPGTALKKRILRGDEPLTNTDKAAKAHDLRYSLAKSNYDIGLADRKMVAAVASHDDAAINKLQGNLIKIKQGLDRLGFRIGSTYGDPELENDPQLLNLYKSELGKLARQGFGRARGRARGKKA